MQDFLKIIFGDLFTFDGFKVIPVSRYFFETDVAESSLQNIILKKFIENYGANRGINKYIEKLELSLNNLEYEEIDRGINQGVEKFYSLGTTALINLRDEEYLFFSITKTELNGHIPNDNCNATNMWISLKKFWHGVRQYSTGKSINIPLIGSGITGINLSANRILELNLLSILNSIIEEGVITSGEIRIILHQKYYEEVDIDSISKMWS